MKKILRYYFKRPKGIEREIEHNTYGFIFLIAFFLGVFLSEYIEIAYWIGFLMVFLPINIYRQYRKITALERKDGYEKKSV
ncbi:hypothetical protein [Atopococcus tabaci]|uniref:hypothetical protein n=1 Tax=Atopococcus tabaci TaxID=269774 RepID=UPI0012EB2C75|nr:hypothetical protein [Atopococcus tabaci]